MPKKTQPSTHSLLDAVRALEADGPMESVVLATYGLSLEQPNFFEHDFLPTLLGIGGVRDRGYVSPINLERKLAEAYCALICDAHALSMGIRPSLRIDVIPVARPRHHAKVVLIHRKRLVRLIITSANLTHDGYRSQREIASVLDFRPDGMLPREVLAEAVSSWIEVLGASATTPVRNALQAAVAAVAGWTPQRRSRTAPKFRVVFGGGEKPLWQELVDAWPAKEPLLSWRVCSPFWPSGKAKSTPFDVIAKGLQAKKVSLTDTVIELICLADVPGDRSRPVFPFPLLRGLRKRGFPVTRGRIVPARLEALQEEVPERKAEGNRALHAKWIMLRGTKSAVALLGSANFTNPGLGVESHSKADVEAGKPGTANIEAGMLITCAIEELPEDAWKPPVVDAGSVDWASCAGDELAVPPAASEDALDWPEHIRRVDLDIHWGDGADPTGTLFIDLWEERFCASEIFSPEESDSSPQLLLSFNRYPSENQGRARVDTDSVLVRRLLVHRTVRVHWDQPLRQSLFPINILETAKAGLPSILGVRPDEQQLLAYFHGRIGEDDLLLLLEQRASKDDPREADRAGGSPSVEFQNYLLREFVESLFGLQDMLNAAMFSPRALEQALLGDFSPASLGERIMQAYQAGRRSATATAFQLTELLRVASSLTVADTHAASDDELNNIESIKERGVARLLSLVETAGQHEPFKVACKNAHFTKFVQFSLPKKIGARFLSIVGAAPTADHATEGRGSTEGAGA
ncbi:MAG: hypothetical protein LC803_08940 [Acidobacteria bacterium]|nr:hypothetical protein [Acidobacteriota bacterium]